MAKMLANKRGQVVGSLMALLVFLIIGLLVVLPIAVSASKTNTGTSTGNTLVSYIPLLIVVGLVIVVIATFGMNR